MGNVSNKDTTSNIVAEAVDYYTTQRWVGSMGLFYNPRNMLRCQASDVDELGRRHFLKQPPALWRRISACRDFPEGRFEEHPATQRLLF